MNLTEADKRKLRDAFSMRASVNGNLMNFIGLDEVRDRFPAMWDRNRERIRATTLAILKQYTDPHTDVVLPVGDANFVVLFTRLDKQEALLRASVIKAEVLRRFLGDDALASLDMQVRAMEMDSGTVLSGGLGDLLSAPSAQTASPPPANDENGHGLPPGPRRPLARTVAAPQSSAAKAHRASIDEMLGHASLPVDEFAARFDFSFDELDYGFQPFLYAERGVFTVFGCRPVRCSATGDILTGYEVLPREAGAEQIATLDKMVLMRVRHGLVDMALRKRVAVVVVPVAFETMTDRRAAMEYLDLLQKVPSDLRNYLVPGLCRCPDGVPSGRLAEIVNPLKRLGRAITVRLDSAAQPLAPFKAAGAFSVGINLQQLPRRELDQADLVERFAANARKLGLHCYVDGIDRPDMAERCRAAGVTYLGGRAFAELSDYVGPVSQPQSA